MRVKFEVCSFKHFGFCVRLAKNNEKHGILDTVSTCWLDNADKFYQRSIKIIGDYVVQYPIRLPLWLYLASIPRNSEW